MEKEHKKLHKGDIDKYGNIIDWEEPKFTITKDSGLDKEGNIPVFNSIDINKKKEDNNSNEGDENEQR